MEVAVELEDDLFFADLSKQISLLIMDDDEDPVARCPSVSFQVFYHLNAFHSQQTTFSLAFSGIIFPGSRICKKQNCIGLSCFVKIFSPSLVQITQYHNLHFFKSKSADEKAKAQEFLSQSHHSQEGSIDKEDIVHSAQSLTGSMTTVQKWFLKHLTVILLTQGEAKGFPSLSSV